MKMFTAILLCTGLVAYLTEGSAIKEDSKRFFLTICIDININCAAYPPSICSDSTYAEWAKANCKKTCNLCSEGSSGSVPQPVRRSTSGCFYKSQIYQEGTTWNDGCKYKCECTDGWSGKYECRQLCLDLNSYLPPACTTNPPAPGKCCPTPSCPSNITIQYQPGYVEE